MDTQTGSDAPKGKSKIRRAWGYYRWFDRIKGWHDWSTWIASFFQTKAGIVVALGSTAMVTTAAVVGHNMVDDPYDDIFTPTEIAAPVSTANVRQTQSTRIFAITGQDKAGRRGTFDVVVANKDFLWVRGSSDDLEKAGKVISGEVLAQEVLDADVRASLRSSIEIIAVGTASQEGDASEETQRAKRRAERTAELDPRRGRGRHSDLDVEPRAVPRARNRRHQLAAAVHGHRGQGAGARRQSRRSAGGRHDGQGEAPEPGRLLGLRSGQDAVAFLSLRLGVTHLSQMGEVDGRGLAAARRVRGCGVRKSKTVLEAITPHPRPGIIAGPRPLPHRGEVSCMRYARRSADRAWRGGHARSSCR